MVEEGMAESLSGHIGDMIKIARVATPEDQWCLALDHSLFTLGSQAFTGVTSMFICLWLRFSALASLELELA